MIISFNTQKTASLICGQEFFFSVAHLVRAVDRQSKDPGSNPGAIESVTFSIERLLKLFKKVLSIQKNSI